MNKSALYATLAMLPVLAYAPLTNAAHDAVEPTSKVIKLDKPLQVGDKMINFELDNPAGGKVSLDKMLAEGPVVLTFFRGSWCPYCIDELDDVQSRLKKIEDAGGNIFAISPETAEKTTEFIEKKKLAFTFGTDHDNALAKQLALAFRLDPKTIKAYRNYGIDVPESNDTKRWELPIPATYVIDTDHTIHYAFVDEDYSKRANYDKVIEVLKELQEDD